MAKPIKNTENIEVTPVAATPVVVAPEPPPAPETTPTEIATVSAAPNAITRPGVDDGVTALHLVPLIPHKEKKLRKLHVPSEEEYAAARAALTPASGNKLDELLERLSPDKLGDETGGGRFRPMTIRLKQGVSKDPECPEMCDVGGLYTSDGIVLTAPTEMRATKGGVPMAVFVVPLLIWKGRVLFAPRVNNKIMPLDAFGDANPDWPYCRSLDRERGAPAKNVAGVGVCADCPYKPWKVPGEANLCSDNVTVMFVLLQKNADGSYTCFDGLYEMTFSKSAAPTGNEIANIVSKNNLAWDRVLKLSTKEEDGKEGKYFVPKIAAVTDATGRPEKISKADSKMLELLYNQIAVRYYFPALADVYRRSNNAQNGGADAPAQTDMSELERRASERAGTKPAKPGSDMRDADV